METVHRDAPPAAAPLEALARIGAAIAQGESLGPVLTELVEAVADAVGATLVVVRTADGEGRLCARGVAAASGALGAILWRRRADAVAAVTAFGAADPDPDDAEREAAEAFAGQARMTGGT